jgi:hypothetical protein
MKRWVNLLGYQAVWLITVSGAAHHATWPACSASSLLCAGHLIRSSRKPLDLSLIGIAALMGAVTDGFLASTGLLRYSPATPALPVAGCPLWILALWVAFSTTVTRSLGWLWGRPITTVFFGALGGPLAYIAAARGWHVITFELPRWRGLLALAIAWAGALIILVRLAGGALPSIAWCNPRKRNLTSHERVA